MRDRRSSLRQDFKDAYLYRCHGFWEGRIGWKFCWLFGFVTFDLGNAIIFPTSLDDACLSCFKGDLIAVSAFEVRKSLKRDDEFCRRIFTFLMVLAKNLGAMQANLKPFWTSAERHFGDIGRRF